MRYAHQSDSDEDLHRALIKPAANQGDKARLLVLIHSSPDTQEKPLLIAMRNIVRRLDRRNRRLSAQKINGNTIKIS